MRQANSSFYSDFEGNRFVVKGGVFDQLFELVIAPHLPAEFLEKAVEALNNSEYNKENKSAVSLAVNGKGEAAFYGRSADFAPVFFNYKPGKLENES